MTARTIACGAALAVLACGSGQEMPDPGTGESSTSTGADETPTTSAGMMSGDPSTSTSTTEASMTSTSTTDASMTSTTESEESSTTEEELPFCGPACAETWQSAESLTIGPGDDLAQFACLTRVHGSLVIEGLSSAELAVLANLRRVDEDLRISGPEIAELGAFACLARVGSLELVELPALGDASGLAGLRMADKIRIEGTGLASLPTLSPEYAGIQEFVAAGNPALVDLDPMAEWPGLSASPDLQVRDNPVLTDIAGLAGPLGAAPDSATVTLERLPALPSLIGLPAHDSMAYRLHDLPLVSDLVPLTGVSHLYWLEISGMPLVTSLAGLHELSSALVFRIGDCWSESSGMDGLTDLSGLDALGQVEFLSFVNNAALASLAGAPNLHMVYVLDVVNDPLVDAADVAAFVAPLEFTPDTCVGEWGQCMCTPYES